MTFSNRQSRVDSNSLHGKFTHNFSELASFLGQVRWRNLSLGAVMLAASATPAIAAGPARLGELKVMLWYQETGYLSESIAPPRSVSLFNTCIGEGDAKENADDVLFTVEVRTYGQQNVPQPVTLTATNSRGAVLARRMVKDLLTGDNGRASIPLLVQDIGCGVGAVTFSARFGNQNKAVTLNFDGGE